MFEAVQVQVSTHYPYVWHHSGKLRQPTSNLEELGKCFRRAQWRLETDGPACTWKQNICMPLMNFQTWSACPYYIPRQWDRYFSRCHKTLLCWCNVDQGCWGTRLRDLMKQSLLQMVPAKMNTHYLLFCFFSKNANTQSTQNFCMNTCVWRSKEVKPRYLSSEALPHSVVCFGGTASHKLSICWWGNADWPVNPRICLSLPLLHWDYKHAQILAWMLGSEGILLTELFLQPSNTVMYRQ